MASKNYWLVSIFTVVLLMLFFAYYGIQENILPIMLLGVCLGGIISKKNWGLFFGFALLLFLFFGSAVELSLILNPDGIEKVYSPVEQGLISLTRTPSFENIGLLASFAVVCVLGAISLVKSRKMFP